MEMLMLRLNETISTAKDEYTIYKMVAVRMFGSKVKTLCILKSKTEFVSGRRGLIAKKVQKWIDGSMYPDGTGFVYDEYLPLRKDGNKWYYWNDHEYAWRSFGEDKTKRLNDRYDPVFEQVASNKIKSLSSLLDEGELLNI